MVHVFDASTKRVEQKNQDKFEISLVNPKEL